MVGWFEVMGERNDPKKPGSVRLNTFYETRKKPVWLVATKLLCVLAMMGIGYLFLMQFLMQILSLPIGQSFLVASGCLLIYVGIAFFIRPEPNPDNMGFLGGMMNDPTHYSDNISRALWNAHCMLGPGRFISETLLDCTTLLGLTAEITAEQANEEEMQKEKEAIERDVARWHEEAAAKVEQRRSERPGGTVELTTAAYLDPDRFGE
jgi:hypothetical protein